MMYLQRFDNSGPVAILNADGSVKQYYSRLGNALAAAKDGDTIKLFSNFTTKEKQAEKAGYTYMNKYTMDIDKRITLDLNKHEINNDELNVIFEVKENGHLTINNGALNCSTCFNNHGTVITNKVNLCSRDRAVNNWGNFTMNGGTAGSWYSECISNKKGAICNLNDGAQLTASEVHQNESCVWNKGEVNINDATLHAYASVINNKGTLNIAKGTLHRYSWKGECAIDGGKYNLVSPFGSGIYFSRKFEGHYLSINYNDYINALKADPPKDAVAEAYDADGNLIDFFKASKLKNAFVADKIATVKLLKDVSIDKTINISKDFTLDLNGHTFTSNADYAIEVGSGDVSAKFTLTDSAGAGKIISTGIYSGISVYNNSSLIMNGGEISKTKSNSTGVLNHGKFILNKGTISATQPESYGVYNDCGTSIMIMNGGTISVSSADSRGICNYKGTVTMNGGEISATGDDSYGLYNSKGTVTIAAGSISGTKNAIFDNKATTTISGAKTLESSKKNCSC